MHQYKQSSKVEYC